MSQSLENYYLEILGNPEVGNVSDLEKKFRRKSAEYIIHRVDDRVDISLVQKSGELTNAYLYLKAKWELSAGSKPYIPSILRINFNKENNKSKNLESFYLKIKDYTLSIAFCVGILAFINLFVDLQSAGILSNVFLFINDIFVLFKRYFI